MYQKNALKRYGWNGSGRHGLTVEFCILTALKREGRIRLSMETIGLVIREGILLLVLTILFFGVVIAVRLKEISESIRELNDSIEKLSKKIKEK